MVNSLTTRPQVALDYTLVALTPRFRRGGRTPNAPDHHLPTCPPSPATGCWADAANLYAR